MITWDKHLFIEAIGHKYMWICHDYLKKRNTEEFSICHHQQFFECQQQHSNRSYTIKVCAIFDCAEIKFSWNFFKILMHHLGYTWYKWRNNSYEWNIFEHSQISVLSRLIFCININRLVLFSVDWWVAFSSHLFL